MAFSSMSHNTGAQLRLGRSIDTNDERKLIRPRAPLLLRLLLCAFAYFVGVSHSVVYAHSALAVREQEKRSVKAIERRKIKNTSPSAHQDRSVKQFSFTKTKVSKQAKNEARRTSSKEISKAKV